MSSNPMTGLDGRNPAKVGVTSVAVTPNDNADLPDGARWLWIGVGGDVKVTLVDDPASHTGVVFKNAPAGPFPYAVRRLYAASTTATNIVGGT